MLNLNREDVLEKVGEKLTKSPFMKDMPEEELQAFTAAAYDADHAYMQKAGVLDGDYYDEDDAFETIVDSLSEHFSLSEEDQMLLCQRIEAYMDAFENYLEERDFVEWD
ncbi:hypothetical protein [Gehongia tenuis]|uniref:Uncharacterized protein n=1 Tax=Gehongia tenuis TaxID=2763655 RepID=A0A926D680_9FIRM|nr:hypothetical protein [Gehongia tenuis]MBC8532001.1 hypothetical protein [Gehongia tenuis]